MTNLKGATKFGLIAVSVLVAILGASFLISFSSAGFGGVFVISNITASGQTNIFAETSSGVNVTTTLESGATNVTFNISLKVLDAATNLTNVTIILPSGITFSPEFSNATNASAANVTAITFWNVTSGGVTNLSWSNRTQLAMSGENFIFTNTSRTTFFSFRANIPAGITMPTNNSLNITVVTVSQATTTFPLNHMTLGVFINDTILPNNLRYIDTTAIAVNNSNTTNTSVQLMVGFNETNPASVNLSVGFGNNASSANKSMTIQGGKNFGNATASVNGLPDGKHNFTFFVTDVQNRQTANTTTYFVTVDTTAPGLTLTLPTSDVSKGSTVSSSNIGCSATDATSGLNTSSFSISIQKPTGTTVNHNCGNDFTDTADVGDYSATFSTTDMAGNSATKTGTFKVAYQQQTTKTGTSASTPSTSATVIATKTLTVTETLTSAKPVAFVVPIEVSSKSSVDKLTIDVTKDVTAADSTVEIKALDKVPTKDDHGATLTALPSADQPVVKVIQVTPSAKVLDALKQATIDFTLTDAELAKIGKAEDVVLVRFADGKWNELATTSLGAGKYKAVTLGFSVFVVTKKAPAASATPVASTPTPAAVSGTPSVATPTPAATSTPAPKPKGGLSDTLLYAIVGIIVVIVVVVVVLTSKKKK